ncbi:MAG: hypothetical protein Q4F31_04270 [Eubacteriales bacterium]|nr:hypothetical protein [Eubacteriales bacterium]
MAETKNVKKVAKKAEPAEEKTVKKAVAEKEAPAAEKKTAAKKSVTKVESAVKEEAPVKNTPKTVTKADPEGAKSKRILAWVFWVLAIACEVLAVLVFIGKIDLHFCSQIAQLIGFLVLDFILVVVGAQFWKKANHMDPISESNKVKFWLWNNMGVIVCCVAFIPFLIYVLFVDKNADPKLKKVASIAAAIALALGIGLSADWNPVSEEGLEQAQQTLAGTDVYWTQFGSVYHTDMECQHLNRSSELYQGDVSTAISEGKTRLCKTCAKNSNIEIDNNGAITAAPVEFVEEVEDIAEDVAEELDEAAA